jgi:uncharacterized SAM-binding protein YcdF (DUF218 family)
VGRPGSSRLTLWIPLLLLLGIVATGPFFWMPRLAAALIRDDGPAKADIAVVLAGDPHGQRILAAASLVREGYVPSVLVSGPVYFDQHESDAAIEFAVHRGSPAEWFIGLPNTALSTRDEARVVLDELKRRNVRSFLRVTSDYHTRRAGRIYAAAIRQMGGSPEMRVVAAPDAYFRRNGWWQSREGAKFFVLEWIKSFATAIGI